MLVKRSLNNVACQAFRIFITRCRILYQCCQVINDLFVNQEKSFAVFIIYLFGGGGLGPPRAGLGGGGRAPPIFGAFGGGRFSAFAFASFTPLGLGGGGRARGGFFAAGAGFAGGGLAAGGRF